jgi:hypothetical protein
MKSSDKGIRHVRLLYNPLAISEEFHEKDKANRDPNQARNRRATDVCRPSHEALHGVPVAFDHSADRDRAGHGEHGCVRGLAR